MWTPTTRAQHDRDHFCYASDLSDAEWAIVEPLMRPARRTGRPRDWSWREILDAIFYVPPVGASWRMLSQNFPPRQTVYRWSPTASAVCSPCR
jgi:transposase